MNTDPQKNLRKSVKSVDEKSEFQLQVTLLNETEEADSRERTRKNLQRIVDAILAAIAKNECSPRELKPYHDMLLNEESAYDARTKLNHTLELEKHAPATQDQVIAVLEKIAGKELIYVR